MHLAPMDLIVIGVVVGVLLAVMILWQRGRS